MSATSSRTRSRSSAPTGRSGVRSAPPAPDPGELTAVGAVAVAPDGSVYVADGTDRIHRYAADGSLLNSWGSSGSAPGEFHFGAGGGNDSGAGGGIALGPDGSVYVADTRNDRVQRFAADGTGAVVIVPPGRLARPQGLAVRGSRLIVADDVHHRLAIFDTGGRLLTSVGTGEGNRPGQLQNPYDVAVDPAGRLYVADNSNHRVVRYGPAPSYKYRARWGAFGSGRGQLQYPRGIAVDATGRTFVADPGGNRIDVFDIGGTSLGSLGSSGRAAGPVHPAAGRRRRRGWDARGRRLDQRAHRAAQPGRRRRRDVRRAGARADAAARPGGRRVRQLRARSTWSTRTARACWSSTARARSSARSARAGPAPGSCSRRPRWRSRPPARSTWPTPATAGSCASRPPARTSAPSAASARSAGSPSRPTARGCTGRTPRPIGSRSRRPPAAIWRSWAGPARGPGSCATRGRSRPTRRATSGWPIAATTASSRSRRTARR